MASVYHTTWTEYVTFPDLDPRYCYPITPQSEPLVNAYRDLQTQIGKTLEKISTSGTDNKRLVKLSLQIEKLNSFVTSLFNQMRWGPSVPHPTLCQSTHSQTEIVQIKLPE